MIRFEPPLHEPPGRAAARWIGAAVLVVTLHVGSAALALLHWPERDEGVEDMGTPMVVELAEMPSAQESEQADANDAEPTEASAATPDLQESKSAPTDSELPTAVASPYEAPPELRVAQEKTEQQEEPVEDTQPTEASETQQPTPPSAPAQQAAPSAPPINAVDALVGAPQEGSTADFTKAQETWYRAIMAHLGKHKRYPDAARARHVEGETTVRFVLDRGGRVIRSEVVHSSGSPLLDREVLALLERATPLPSLPPHMRGEHAELTMPIRFRLK